MSQKILLCELLLLCCTLRNVLSVSCTFQLISRWEYKENLWVEEKKLGQFIRKFNFHPLDKNRKVLETFFSFFFLAFAMLCLSPGYMVETTRFKFHETSSNFFLFYFFLLWKAKRRKMGTFFFIFFLLCVLHNRYLDFAGESLEFKLLQANISFLFFFHSMKVML
jgi:hypothetical protein